MKIELDLRLSDVRRLRNIVSGTLIVDQLTRITVNLVLEQIDKQLPPVKQSLASGPRSPQDPTVKS
jgi:hypothetical protein